LNDQIICYALPDDASAVTAITAGAAGASAPTQSATFASVYTDVIAKNACSVGQCHSSVAAGSLDLTTRELAYQNLVGVRAMGSQTAGAASGCAGSGLMRVAPRDPDHSLLVTKLEHTQTCGSPMPNAATRLSEAQLHSVRAWISAGAPND
jgi:predicted deacylase